MRELKSATKNATRTWRPPRYPVAWVDEPSEVPKWDSSRGGNPYTHLHLEDWGFNQERERLKAEYGEDVELHLPDADMSLGGTKPPPPRRRTTVMLGGGEGDEYTAFERDNYPRLVRETPLPVELSPIDGSVSKALSDLYEYLGNEETFKEKVIAFVSRFAPLGYSEKHDTLDEWKQVVGEMRFYLELLKFITDFERTADDAYTLDGFSDELSDWLEERLKDKADDAPAHLWTLELALKKDKSPLEQNLSMPPTLKGVKDGMAKLFWDIFAAQAYNKIQISTIPGDFSVSCGALGWAYHELWSYYSEGVEVRVCLGCNRPFIVTRTDALVCPGSRACAKAKERKGLSKPKAKGKKKKAKPNTKRV
jgi:hypothetical protein